MPLAPSRIRDAVSLALMALVGCHFGWSDTGPDDDDNPVRTRSYDYAATSLLLSANGNQAVMSTSAGVVVFDTTTGDASATTPAEDFAEPTVEDWVGDKVAIVDRNAETGVFLWEPGELGYELREDEEAGSKASNALGFSSGLAWIGRRATNCRILRDGLDLAIIEPCGYIRDLDVVDADGTLFLGYDDDQGGLVVLRVDPDGSQVSLDTPMDMLSWDNVRQVLYTATADTTRVEAVTVDGGPVFSVDLPGTVLDLVALEQQGLLAVLATQGSDAYMHIIDQYTGEELREIEAAPASTSLAASSDSSTIAILQADRMAILTVDWTTLLAASDTGE